MEQPFLFHIFEREMHIKVIFFFYTIFYSINIPLYFVYFETKIPLQSTT